MVTASLRGSGALLDELLEETKVLAFPDATERRVRSAATVSNASIDRLRACADRQDRPQAPPFPWWWWLFTGARSPTIRPSRIVRLYVDVVVGEDPGVCLCFSSPTTSGRCWTRSPPRATLKIWLPRHTASTGMSRSSAAWSAISARSRSGRMPFVSGWASAPCRAGSRSSRRRRGARRARRGSP